MNSKADHWKSRLKSTGLYKLLRQLRKLTENFNEKCLDALNRLMPPRGINLGGGRWRKWRWINFDSRHEGTLLTQNTILPFDSNSIEMVFSSHFFEHLEDSTTQRLFDESYRILKPGGVFRIIVPDFEKALVAYRHENHSFFDEGDWGFSPRYENWQKQGVEPSLENKVSYAFFGFSNLDGQGRFPPWHFIENYYCGPALIPKDKLAQAAKTMSIHQFSQFVQSYKPPTYFDLGHINVYDIHKFQQMLGQSGFSAINRCAPLGSSKPELRQKAFDNRFQISLFVEAQKL